MFGRIILFVLESIASFFALFKPAQTPMLAGAPSLSLVGGHPNGIGSTLFNFNRHESGVSRRSSDRNT